MSYGNGFSTNIHGNPEWEREDRRERTRMRKHGDMPNRVASPYLTLYRRRATVTIDFDKLLAFARKHHDGGDGKPVEKLEMLASDGSVWTLTVNKFGKLVITGD